MTGIWLLTGAHSPKVQIIINRRKAGQGTVSQLLQRLALRDALRMGS